MGKKKQQETPVSAANSKTAILHGFSTGDRDSISPVSPHEQLLLVRELLEKKGFQPVFADSAEKIPASPDSDSRALHIVNSSISSEHLDKVLEASGNGETPGTCIIFSVENDHSRAMDLLERGAYALIKIPLDPREAENVLDRCIERMTLLEEKALADTEIAVLERAFQTIVFSPKRLSRCMYLSDFGQAFMKEFQSILNATGGSFFMLEDNRLLRVYSLDPGHTPEEINLPLPEDSLLARAHETREPVLVRDLHAEKAGLPSGWQGYKNNSLLVLPLTYNHKHLLGFISLHNKEESGFTEHDAKIGEALAAVGSGVLLTLKELAQAQDREEQFRQFFLESAAANCIAWPDGDMLLANSTFCTMLGIPDPDERVNLPQFFPAPEDWKNLVSRVSLEKKLLHHELHLVNRDKKAVTAAGTITGKFNRKGKLVDMQFSVTDISHRRRLEHELSQSLKMEAVGRLAGGVAHDFNNIIAVILGYSEILMENLSNTPFKNDIIEIRRAAQKAADIAKQLLYFSRKQVERPSVINLVDSIREMERMLRRLLGDNIQFFTECETGEALVAADKGQIEQVLMNLVVNARDAMPRGGSITIRTRDANDDSGRPQVILEIADSGIGMSAEIQEHIFDPFFSTKEMGKGTGLGLATVNAIVSSAGGKISVHSEPDKGSTFTLFFPRATAKPARDESAKAPVATSGRTGRILVVEDDRNIRMLIAKILGYHGYEISQAEDGDAALKLSATVPRMFDLVVLDMIMPGMNGKETSEHLRKKFPGLPILFISGYTDDTLVKNGCPQDRFTDFITKPFDSDTLQKKVREILDRKNGGS